MYTIIPTLIIFLETQTSFSTFREHALVYNGICDIKRMKQIEPSEYLDDYHKNRDMA